MSGPSGTPWGHPDSRETIAPGIVSYSTSSHGGLWLDPSRWTQLQDAVPGFKPWAGAPWLEEDCDALVAALVFPGALGDRMVYYAVRTAQAVAAPVAREPAHYWAAVCRFVASGDPRAELVRSIHDAYAARVADSWEVVACGSAYKGAPSSNYWGVSLRHVTTGARRSAHFAKMPEGSMYSGAELDAIDAAAEKACEVSA